MLVVMAVFAEEHTIFLVQVTQPEETVHARRHMAAYRPISYAKYVPPSPRWLQNYGSFGGPTYYQAGAPVTTSSSNGLRTTESDSKPTKITETHSK